MQISLKTYSLSKWLRLLLKDNDHQIIDLKKEISLIISFLELEKIKLEHELKYLILDLTSSKLEFQVPFFILQPIIENTLKYSFLKSKKPPRIAIIIEGNKNILKINIIDNGHGKEISNKHSTKNGFSIIRRKLKLYDILTKTLIPSSYQISFQEKIGSCSQVKIMNPKTK